MTNEKNRDVERNISFLKKIKPTLKFKFKNTLFPTQKNAKVVQY